MRIVFMHKSCSNIFYGKSAMPMFTRSTVWALPMKSNSRLLLGARDAVGSTWSVSWTSEIRESILINNASLEEYSSTEILILYPRLMRYWVNPPTKCGSWMIIIQLAEVDTRLLLNLILSYPYHILKFCCRAQHNWYDTISTRSVKRVHSWWDSSVCPIGRVIFLYM